MHNVAPRGRVRAATGGLSLKSATALRGSVAALLLFSGAAAQAANECGPPEDGAVFCTPEGNPYPFGIRYVSTEDLTLNVQDGVVTQRGLDAEGVGGASIVINLAQGASITNAGFFGQGVTGFVETGGSLTIDAAGSIVTEGFLASGIRALARGGPITIRAADIDSTGGDGISVGGSESPVLIEATGNIRAQNGTGLFGTGTNSVAGIFVNTQGSAEIINSGQIEQVGSPEADPAGTYLTNGGIHIFTARDAIIRGDGSIETGGFGANGIRANATGTISIRQGSIMTHGERASGVLAFAPGAISVDVDTIISDRALGILVQSSDGDVSIRFDSVSSISLGAYGESMTGSVTIEAGNVTAGADSGGLIGSAVQIVAGAHGDVTLNGAIVHEQGFGVSIDSGGDGSALVAETASVDVAHGGVKIVAGGHAALDNRGSLSGGTYGARLQGTSATVVNDGAISGAALGGLLVYADGDVRIEGTGSASVIGENVIALHAVGQTVTVAQDSVSAQGANATGIAAVGVGDVEVDVGAVSSEQYTGVYAESSTGSVDVAVDALEAAGVGIEAVAAGPVSIVLGDAVVSGVEAETIIVDSGGATSVTIAGAVEAAEGFGLSNYSGGDAEVDIASTGSVTAGITAIYASLFDGAGATIRNAGTVSGGSGNALLIEGGSAMIDNEGTINGSILLDGGDDLLSNGGTFNADGDSDFGAGADRLVNGGVLNAAAAGTGSVQLIGLEQLASSGEISLADGEANDVLSLPGDYAGDDGTLFLDIGGGTADLLTIGGAATGRTLVAANGLQGLLDPGTLIVQAGAGSSADAFATDGVNIGFAEYGIRFDAASNSYSLVGAPGDAAYRTVRYLEGAQNLWHDSSDAWAAHVRGLRDASRTGSGFWVQARGSVASRRGGRMDSQLGISTASDTGYRQDHFGAQFGYDFAPGGNGIGFGVTAGYGSSDLSFRQSRSRVDFSGFNVGGYAVFASGPFFANLLGKYDHLSAEISDREIGLAAESDGSAFGARAEVGARFGSDRLFVEPLATLSWVRTDLDTFSALSSAFDFDDGDGLRGKLGARFGSTWGSPDATRFSVYAGGNVVRAFGKQEAVVLTNGGQTIRIENDRIGTYGEAVLGLNVASRGGVTGYFEGHASFGGDDALRGGGGRAGIRIAF